MKNEELTYIPATLQERSELRKALRDFVQQHSLCPPVSLKQLEALAAEFMASYAPADSPITSPTTSYLPWLMVEINNQLWVDIIATIPHERRLLMLPKCLSKHGTCRGEYDAYGLLCHRCGHCLIPDLQDKAEQLGTLSLVAEGFTQVIELIENHVVDAVIGVSCLESLEKAFPLLVSHAVPGLAIPLNDDGCIDTHVDDQYVVQLLTLSAPKQHTLLHHENIRQQIDRWFSREELSCTFGYPKDKTSQVCIDWMTEGGRRWRPYLLSAVYQSITGNPQLTEDVHRAAVAVECFHKASLIHDDIEDGDMVRYDQPTINARYGDAFAINVGDALLGMGYRLLSQSNHIELVRLIAEAHTSLCLGQGNELALGAPASHGEERGVPPTRPVADLETILDIIRHKTVPAFEVSLLLGLACASHQHLRLLLHHYAEALGIAYQLKDDLEDLSQDNGEHQRPTAVYALRYEHPDWSDKMVSEKLSEMIDDYKQQALDALNDLDCLELKRLLYQVTEKILKR